MSFPSVTFQPLRVCWPAFITWSIPEQPIVSIWRVLSTPPSSFSAAGLDIFILLWYHLGVALDHPGAAVEGMTNFGDVVSTLPIGIVKSGQFTG